MNSSSFTLNPSTLRFAPRQNPHAISRPALPSRQSDPTPGTLQLAQRCAQEAARGDQLESHGLLFLAGCALAAVVGCAYHLERFAAHWDTFETFVRALLS